MHCPLSYFIPLFRSLMSLPLSLLSLLAITQEKKTKRNEVKKATKRCGMGAVMDQMRIIQVRFCLFVLLKSLDATLAGRGSLSAFFLFVSLFVQADGALPLAHPVPVIVFDFV